MRFIKIVGLALLASLAVSMVAAASASAELGIFQCEKGVGTSNLGSNCLTETNGVYTVKPITGATFTSKAGATVLATPSKKIECTTAKNEGVITSLTEDRATIKFSGCTSSSNNCQTGTETGVLLVPVSSKIVSYTNSSNELKAGLLLAPRNASGENEVKFECGGVTDHVYGSVIGAIEPAGTTVADASSKSFSVKFVVTSGVQAITEKTNSLRARFSSGATEKATQEGEALLDFTLNVEVMG